MLPGEVDQRLADLGIGEGAGRGELDAAAHVACGVADGIGEVVDLADDLRGALVICVPGFRERELPRGAIEEQRAEFVLQFPHIFRKQRLGAADLAGRRRKAFGLDDVDEGAHAGQSVHEVSGQLPPMILRAIVMSWRSVPERAISEMPNGAPATWPSGSVICGHPSRPAREQTARARLR